jgi:hypothetical protein
VTAADRAKAAEVLTGDVDYYVVRDKIAAALAAARADERARWEAAVQGLAERYETTSRRRRQLAAKWHEQGRWQLADAFRNLARQTDVAAARLRGLTTSSEEETA